MARFPKNAIEQLIVGSGMSALGRRRHRADVLVLAYHNVLPTGERVSGDTSLHLAQRAFESQLEMLERTHDVVPLTSILDRPSNERRPRAVITFDDAYVGAVTVGVQALVKRGLPATIFVAPGILGQHTWWDLLANPEDAAVPPATRDRFLKEFKGEGRTILAQAGASAREPASAAAKIATEREVIDVARQPGITIGSHTWSHPNLQALDRAAIDVELSRSVAWLRERIPSFIPWLAYPYGLHNQFAEAAASSAGFVGALRVDGGWLRSSALPNVFSMPRINIPAGVSRNGFRLRIDGVRS